MLYMVELRYSSERRSELWNYFQTRGVTHYDPSLTLRGAWVSPPDCMAYMLVNCPQEAVVERECQKLEQFGAVVYRPVMDADQL